ncbi:MAG TPA: hypothetical protein VHZ98_09195 [Galbitalea sp.]|nr:hypothetical protein [Galbitalea sp.]
MTFRRVSPALVALAIALTIAGCASTTHAQSRRTTSIPSSASANSSNPSASATKAAAGPIPTPAEVASSGSSVTVPNQFIGDSSTNISWQVEIPSDGPARLYAEGSPIFEGTQLVAYKVAPGDILDFICDRFHLSNNGYIVGVNQIRRGSALIYAGDVLNLSAYTMHKYGSINGKVLDNPDPIPMPSQEL